MVQPPRERPSAWSGGSGHPTGSPILGDPAGGTNLRRAPVTLTADLCRLREVFGQAGAQHIWLGPGYSGRTVTGWANDRSVHVGPPPAGNTVIEVERAVDRDGSARLNNHNFTVSLTWTASASHFGSTDT